MRRGLGRRRINTAMKSEIATTTDHHERWTVEFHELRGNGQNCTLSRNALFAFLRLWLEVITPGAYIIEQEASTATIRIVFASRDASRKFRRCFAGREIQRQQG